MENLQLSALEQEAVATATANYLILETQREVRGLLDTTGIARNDQLRRLFLRIVKNLGLEEVYAGLGMLAMGIIEQVPPDILKAHVANPYYSAIIKHFQR